MQRLIFLRALVSTREAEGTDWLSSVGGILRATTKCGAEENLRYLGARAGV